MSVSLTVNGVAFAYPQTGDETWGDAATQWAQAVTSGMLQKAGGTFTLTADVDFGASFGLKSLYYKSRATNPASAGQVRLGNTEGVYWRNAANNADLALVLNASNELVFNGTIFLNSSGHFLDSTFRVVDGSDNTKRIAFEASGITSANTRTITIPDADVNLGALTNSNISAVAAIAYSKLNLAASIVNADINGSAAIAYSKLNLAGSIVNADVSNSAAIAYSKLNLSGAIVNADISNSAAIAYSKLNLTGTIVNADISGSAAIAYSKLNLSGALVNADISGSAAIAYSKLNLATSIVNSDISGSAAIAFAKMASLTASRALQSGSGGVIEVSAVTSTELGYVAGVTSSIQTQLDAKVAKSTATTKGDLFVATASATIARQGIGTDGHVLTADSTQTNGLKWAAPAAATTVVDNTFVINDNSDATKQIAFDAAGSTGTKTTIAGSQTANRTLTLPDETAAIPGFEDWATVTMTCNFDTGTVTSKGMRIGKTWFYRVHIAFSGTPTGSPGALVVTLPITMSGSDLPNTSGRQILGTARFFDNSGGGNGIIIGQVSYASGTTVKVDLMNTSAATDHYIDYVTPTSPVTIVNLDTLNLEFSVPIA